jgi:hypothetical protein
MRISGFRRGALSTCVAAAFARGVRVPPDGPSTSISLPIDPADGRVRKRAIWITRHLPMTTERHRSPAC